MLCHADHPVGVRARSRIVPDDVPFQSKPTNSVSIPVRTSRTEPIELIELIGLIERDRPVGAILILITRSVTEAAPAAGWTELASRPRLVVAAVSPKIRASGRHAPNPRRKPTIEPS
jgi:hypothetical protein